MSKEDPNLEKFDEKVSQILEDLSTFISQHKYECGPIFYALSVVLIDCGMKCGLNSLERLLEMFNEIYKDREQLEKAFQSSVGGK